MSQRFSLGDLSFTLQDGALRHLRLGQTEIIRQVAFLVRDRDWGTIAPEIGTVEHENSEGALSLRLPLLFRAGPARLAITITLRLCAGSLQMRAEGHSDAPFETNRAGFTLLHPIAGVAGCPATVLHSDGRREDSAFPALIDPWRPYMDIAGLDYAANGLAISCRLSGDTFEMEDQRQWGDASFKTYNRSLDLPWPYELPQGAFAPQEVTLRWQPAQSPSQTVTPALPGQAPARPTFPQTALLVTPSEAEDLAHARQALDMVAPQRILAHVDASAGPVAPQMAAFAALQARAPEYLYDLELICAFATDDPAPELLAHAQAMRAAGFAPASVFVCPAVDRQSTPPGSDWPACPPLTQIHAAAAKAFPDVARGGGMASFFPELNRKRPPVDQLDFVTHGLCPIVHAADDLSVIETLEAVPHITRSAREIAAGCAYRIGPATLAMRQNPYGSRTIPNPEGGAVCMTDDDPRHRRAFGAAYVLGLATALAGQGVAVWTPAGLTGPRGITGPEGAYPLTRVLRALAALAGAPVTRAEITDGIAVLEAGGQRLRANLTPAARDGLPPYGVALPEDHRLEV